MADKSGNGKHATQATSSKRPIYRTSGGLHWLDFDGVDDLLGHSVNPGTGLSCIVAFRTGATINPYAMVVGGQLLRLYSKLSSGTNKWGTFTSADQGAATTLSTSTIYVAGIEGSAKTYHLNNVSDGSFTGTVAAENNNEIGANAAPAMAMRFYGAVTRAGDLGLDRPAVTSWLGQKAGLII